ncbi:MAG: PDZ domain-containing protein [Acidimicrobiales bacterium]|nr:PDZ domain-containing protein [Acidimicrobiales bacterium]
MDREDWDDDDEPYVPPLPPEDRLWRHPSEVAASLRQTAVASAAPSAPPGRLGVALMSALGGALVVAGLWLATTTFGPSSESVRRPVEFVALDPTVATEPIVVSSEAWVETVTREVADGVVAVTAQRGNRIAEGSGVVYQIDGYILTSHRLVAGADRITVTLSDGTDLGATILGTDVLSGIAVIKVDATDIPAAVLGLTRDPLVGDEVILVDARRPITESAIAHLTADDAQVNVRELYGTATDVNLHGLFQLDQPVRRVADGAAIVDTSGAVIGISLDLGTNNGGYAVPIWFARLDVAQDIVDTGAARYAYLGITGSDLSASRAAALGVEGGARIDTVIPGGPAEAAGLVPGDVIVSLDDDDVWSMSDLILSLRTKRILRSMQLGYVRDGQVLRTTITLEMRDTDGL